MNNNNYCLRTLKISICPMMKIMMTGWLDGWDAKRCGNVGKVLATYSRITTRMMMKNIILSKLMILNICDYKLLTEAPWGI